MQERLDNVSSDLVPFGLFLATVGPGSNVGKLVGEDELKTGKPGSGGGRGKTGGAKGSAGSGKKKTGSSKGSFGQQKTGAKAGIASGPSTGGGKAKPKKPGVKKQGKRK